MAKTVLVTGSSKGIGASLIKKFASLGYNVVINYLSSKSKALALQKEVIEKYNVKTLVIQADVTSEEEVNKMFSIIKDNFESLDIIINNAAYANDNNYLDKTKEEFMDVLKVNVYGPFLVTKIASEYMDEGIILNISSTDAVDTYTPLSMDYCASKAALNNLTMNYSLAIPNIKFIGVMLPWVNTESIREMNQNYLQEELKRINQKRLLEPDEVSTKIVDIINSQEIKSGSILKLEDN